MIAPNRVFSLVRDRGGLFGVLRVEDLLSQGVLYCTACLSPISKSGTNSADLASQRGGALSLR
jgi:hypothetical protein